MLALAMNTTYEELNALLKAARLQELYSRDSAEALIIWGLNKGKQVRKSVKCYMRGD